MNHCILEGYNGVQSVSIVREYESQRDLPLFLIIREKRNDYMSLYRTLTDYEENIRFKDRVAEKLIHMSRDECSEIKVVFVKSGLEISDFDETVAVLEESFRKDCL